MGTNIIHMEIPDDPEVSDIYQCEDCGAFCFTVPNDIRHFDGCTPGEAAKWQAHYSQTDLDGPEYDDIPW